MEISMNINCKALHSNVNEFFSSAFDICWFYNWNAIDCRQLNSFYFTIDWANVCFNLSQTTNISNSHNEQQSSSSRLLSLWLVSNTLSHHDAMLKLYYCCFFLLLLFGNKKAGVFVFEEILLKDNKTIKKKEFPKNCFWRGMTAVRFNLTGQLKQGKRRFISWSLI